MAQIATVTSPATISADVKLTVQRTMPEDFIVWAGDVLVGLIERRGDGLYYLSGDTKGPGCKTKPAAARMAFEYAVAQGAVILR